MRKFTFVNFKWLAYPGAYVKEKVSS